MPKKYKKRYEDPFAAKPTECNCPRCKKNHVLDLKWSGKLPARKYCKKCQPRIPHLGCELNYVKRAVGSFKKGAE